MFTLSFNDPILWTVIGILSASWTEYRCQVNHRSHEQREEAEWISWTLLLILSQISAFRQRRQNDHPLAEKGSLNANNGELGQWNLVVVAVANTVARSLFLREELAWVLPLVTVTTSAAVLFSSRGKLHILLPELGRSESGLSSWNQLQASSRHVLTFSITAAVPSVLLLLRPESIAPGFNLFEPKSIVYLSCQTVIFIALSSQLLHVPGGKMLEFPSKVVRSLSQSSMMLWTVVLMMSGQPRSAINVSTIVLGCARSLEWFAILSTCFNTSPIVATIMSTVGVSIGRSLASTSLAGTFQVSVVALIAILHATLALPSHLPRKRYLLLLLLLPACNIMRHSRLDWTPATKLHPIETIIAEAQANFAHMVERQSKTLEEAVTEYRRRYKRHPPPKFDVWYQMAVENNTIPLIDEFDTLMDPIQPFWGISPRTIRGRVESALNGRRIHKFEIENHKWRSNNTKTGRYEYVGQEMATWLQTEHLELLPDLTFVLNFWDEPRVYAPYDTVQQAMAHAFEPLTKSPQQPTWTDQQPLALDDEASKVRFMRMHHTDSWEALKLACPLDSPARSLFTSSSGSTTAASHRLDFKTNTTAYKDLCANPDLAKWNGFISAPAAFDLTHTLVPVFSAGPSSIANDIIFPPAYTGQRLYGNASEYNASGDISWEEKTGSLYWKGSSTGGWATEENWRDLQRQRLSLKFTEAEGSNASVTLLRQAEPGEPDAGKWIPYYAPLSSLASKFDIHLAGELVLCSFPSKKLPESGGCYAESQGLHFGDIGPAEEAWQYKYVLDIDGNGYSGRFFRLLMSNSAVIKMTAFREWFNDWIVPWVHYIPARQDEDFSDLAEIMRFLDSERGDVLGREIAEWGQMWVEKVISRQSLKLWFLRLLMEYGRVVSDDRDNMNYVG